MTWLRHIYIYVYIYIYHRYYIHGKFLSTLSQECVGTGQSVLIFCATKALPGASLQGHVLAPIWVGIATDIQRHHRHISGLVWESRSILGRWATKAGPSRTPCVSVLSSIFHLFSLHSCKLCNGCMLLHARNRRHAGLGSHMCLTTHSFADFVFFWWQAILLLSDCRTSESTGVILRLPMLDVIRTFTNRFVMSQAFKGYGS